MAPTLNTKLSALLACNSLLTLSSHEVSEQSVSTAKSGNTSLLESINGWLFVCKDKE
jgi:hypothetical protein